MRVPHNSMVLVTDGRKRLFFRNEGDALAPNLVVMSAAEDANPKTRDQVTGGGSMPSADAHDIEEERFAAATAEELSRAALAGEFQDLILVAPPKTLGQLRKTLHSRGAEENLARNRERRDRTPRW